MVEEKPRESYKVWVPQLPQADEPDLKNWSPFALENGKFDNNTALVGHSAGCPLVLALLEKLKIKVKKVVLVASFVTPLGNDPEPMLKKYDWEKIKSNSQEFVFINSDNDPWGCNNKQRLKMWEKLGGTLVLRHGEGHMGSEKFKQPYHEFPLLLKLIL